MSLPLLAVIGGSGLNKLTHLQEARYEVARTPYGEPSSPLMFGRIGRRSVVFLARHGHGHTIAPHQVNYRANLWALKEAGASQILSVASVGSTRAELQPGSLVMPDQILDYTWGRQHTFHDVEGSVVHVDFTHPYDEPFRQDVLSAAKRAGIAITASGVYAAVQGPRLESAAEIRRLIKDGADMVGMTGMPETSLARELALPYATVAIVSNWAAGLGSSTEKISIEALRRTTAQHLAQIFSLLDTLCDA